MAKIENQDYTNSNKFFKQERTMNKICIAINNSKMLEKNVSLLKSKKQKSPLKTPESTLLYSTTYLCTEPACLDISKMTKRAQDFWKRKPPLLYETLIEITLLSSLGIITVIRVHTIVDF